MKTIRHRSFGETIQPIRPARSNLLNKQHTTSSNKPGKVAVVGGDGRSSGAATATLLATRGASVVVNYLKNSATASKVIAQIHANGGQALAVQANIRDQQQAEALVQAALAAYGGMNRVYE